MQNVVRLILAVIATLVASAVLGWFEPLHLICGTAVLLIGVGLALVLSARRDPDAPAEPELVPDSPVRTAIIGLLIAAAWLGLTSAAVAGIRVTPLGSWLADDLPVFQQRMSQLEQAGNYQKASTELTARLNRRITPTGRAMLAPRLLRDQIGSAEQVVNPTDRVALCITAEETASRYGLDAGPVKAMHEQAATQQQLLQHLSRLKAQANWPELSSAAHFLLQSPQPAWLQSQIVGLLLDGLTGQAGETTNLQSRQSFLSAAKTAAQENGVDEGRIDALLAAAKEEQAAAEEKASLARGAAEEKARLTQAAAAEAERSRALTAAADAQQAQFESEKQKSNALMTQLQDSLLALQSQSASDRQHLTQVMSQLAGASTRPLPPAGPADLAQGDTATVVASGFLARGTAFVDVDMRDCFNRSVRQLVSRDFQVRVGGIAVAPSGLLAQYFPAANGSDRASLAIVVDSSESMSDVALNQAIQGIQRYITESSGLARVEIFAFDGGVRKLTEWTEDASQQLSALKGQGNDRTIWDAVKVAADDLARQSGPRRMLLVTGGRDTSSQQGLKAVARFCQDKNIQVHAVGLGTRENLDQDCLLRLTSLTGGAYTEQPQAERLAKSFASEMPFVLKAFYRLVFPANIATDSVGGRDFEVMVGGANHILLQGTLKGGESSLSAASSN